MNRGADAESPSASRNRLIAALSPCSKSTNVWSGQSARCSSSRVTSDPRSRTSISRTRNNWSGSTVRLPSFQSSPVRTSKLYAVEAEAIGVPIGSSHGPALIVTRFLPRLYLPAIETGRHGVYKPDQPGRPPVVGGF